MSEQSAATTAVGVTASVTGPASRSPASNSTTAWFVRSLPSVWNDSNGGLPRPVQVRLAMSLCTTKNGETLNLWPLLDDWVMSIEYSPLNPVTGPPQTKLPGPAAPKRPLSDHVPVTELTLAKVTAPAAAERLTPR